MEIDLKDFNLDKELESKLLDYFKKFNSGLEQNRDEILAEKKQLQKSVDEMKDQLKQYEGIDPDKVRKLMSQAQTDEEKKMLESGQIGELIQKKVAQEITPLKEQLQQKDKMFSEMQAERDAERKRRMRSDLHEELRKQAQPIKDLEPTAVDDLILRADNVWQHTENGFAAMDGDKPIIKDGKPLGMREWIEGFRESHHHYFGRATGTGAPGTDNNHDGARPKKVTGDVSEREKQIAQKYPELD